MAFLAAIFGFVGRFAGRVLTTTLGWASTLLFGRVPQQRQVVLALVTFGSVVWAALVIGVALPEIGASSSRPFPPRTSSIVAGSGSPCSSAR